MAAGWSAESASFFADASVAFASGQDCGLSGLSRLVFTTPRTLRQTAHLFICITRNAEQRYRSE
jgi:hypothetical protein